jgi:hypothetical protein
VANELDALDPVPEQVKLLSGTVVVLEDLKARQFFRLLRIITHGALPGMRESGLFEMDGLDSDEFIGRLLSVTLLSIPDAEDETIEFIRSMCKPDGLIEGRRLNKQDTERNTALWAGLAEELENPELDDLVTIIEAVVMRESADIQALGKRLAGMFKLAAKTGQLDPSRNPTSAPTPTSSADSPEPSTSSPPSTAGTTTSSAASASVVYDSAWQRSESGDTTSAGSASNG